MLHAGKNEVFNYMARKLYSRVVGFYQAYQYKETHPQDD